LLLKWATLKYASGSQGSGVTVEPVRIDEFTDRKFTFIFDPDNSPIEIYEQ
jgi:glyoxylase I family protein